MSHLAPCPVCNRHVDVGESACPFCAAGLAESFRAQPAPAAPPRRLSRAAMMAAGATLMGAAACNSNDAIGSTPATDGAVATDAYRPVPGPVYGSPPISLGTGGTSGAGGASAITGSGGSTDAGNDGATDAAPSRDAAQARDAAHDRSVIAIYGAAFAGGLTSEEPNS
jgi:hypothetical protein